MNSKEKILRGLALFASMLIIFPFILGLAEGTGSGGEWGVKAFLLATGISTFAAVFWYTIDWDIFED